MICTLAQIQSSPATESARGASAGVAGCAICGKTAEETQFTQSQKKRLRKGKTARCELCTAATNSKNVITPEIVHTNEACCTLFFLIASFKSLSMYMVIPECCLGHRYSNDDYDDYRFDDPQLGV